MPPHGSITTLNLAIQGPDSPTTTKTLSWDSGVCTHAWPGPAGWPVASAQHQFWVHICINDNPGSAKLALGLSSLWCCDGLKLL